MSPQQFLPFELRLVPAKPKLNLNLLNTSLANFLFFGTIQSSQSRQTPLHSPSPKAVVIRCFFFSFSPPAPPGLTTLCGTSSNVSLPCRRRKALCQQPTSGREIYICEKHMYRTAITQIINIYTADNSHHGQDEYCHNSNSCWGGACKI